MEWKKNKIVKDPREHLLIGIKYLRAQDGEIKNTNSNHPQVEYILRTSCAEVCYSSYIYTFTYDVILFLAIYSASHFSFIHESSKFLSELLPHLSCDPVLFNALIR